MTETQIRQAAAEARQTTLRQFFSAREASRAIGAAQDKTMLSLSGGALVFSMTLVGSFAPARLLLPILVLSWIAFAISMVAVVFGIRAEQLAIHQDLQETAQVLLQIDQGEASAIASHGEFRLEHTVSKNLRVSLLNNLATGGFLAGVALLGVFVAYNLWHR